MKMCVHSVVRAFGVIAMAALYAGPFNASAQNLFVSSHGTVYKITPGGTQSVFVSGLAYNSAGLAFDGTNNLYVGVQGLSPIISLDFVTPAGSSSTFATQAGSPGGLAFNSAGNLFVANASGSGAITEYAPDGSSSPFASGLSEAQGLAFDSQGNLYEADQGSGNIYKFTPGGAQSTFAYGLSEPTGLAFDSSSNLFVSDLTAGAVYKYTPAGTQSTVLTGLYNPQGLAFDNAGNLYVAVGASGYENFGPPEIIKISPAGTQSVFKSGLIITYMAFQPVPALQSGLSNGSVLVTVTAPSPYYPTVLQYSTNQLNWINICTNTPPFTYTNTMTSGPMRFFRAYVSQPGF